MAEAMAFKFRLLDEGAEAFVTDYVGDLPQSVADIHGNLLRCLPHGIGLHHAGLLPKAKAAVEELFLRGYLPVVFCTETFAMGVNFPARTVVFAATTKRGDEGYRPLTAREMLQISGRAGRRGIDTRGYAYVLVDPQYPEEVPVSPPKEPEPLAPELVLTYEGVLRLIFRLGMAGEDAIKTYFRKGFSAYRMREPLISLTRELEDLQRQRDVLLRAEGCPGTETECAERIMKRRRSLAAQIGQWEKQKKVALGKIGTRRERKARVLLALAEQRLSALEHELLELPEPGPCPQGAKVLGGGRCPFFSALAALDKKIRRLRAKLDNVDVAEATWHQFMKSRTVLERAGFIDDLSLTAKGGFALACGPGGVLFAEIMAEIAGVGIAGANPYEAEPEQIAGYAAGSLCEDEERSSPARFLPLPVAKAVGLLRSSGLQVLYSTKDASTLETWALGHDVLTAALRGDMAPGDFIMLARRAAETLRGASAEEGFLHGMRPVLVEALHRVWKDEVADVL